MAQYGSQFPKTDVYGNPVQTTGGADYGGAYQNQPSATVIHSGTTGATGYGQDAQLHGTTGAGTGIFQRSGSSNSSSSYEDDEMGGRRKKKGVMNKIKEKLTGGGHGKEEPMKTTAASGGTAAGTYGHEGQYHEKKGMMEKIKDMLPGHHH